MKFNWNFLDNTNTAFTFSFCRTISRSNYLRNSKHFLQNLSSSMLYCIPWPYTKTIFNCRLETLTKKTCSNSITRLKRCLDTFRFCSHSNSIITNVKTVLFTKEDRHRITGLEQFQL